LQFNRPGSNAELGTELTMADRRKPLSFEHEEIIAAFDRERDKAHELNRRHYETVNNSRRNDRIVGRDHYNHDR
jgi:hypothetical protein